MTGRTLWVGTYPAAGQGTPTGLGEGIWRISLDPRTGVLGDAELVAVTPAPSFLCEGQTPTRLFAANEEEGSDGQVTAWAVADGGLVPVAAAGSGGRHPCHVVYLPTLGAVVASNYTGGSVAVLPAGPLTEGELHRFSGHGPLAARQEGPHAHQAYPAPGGEVLLVNDLGSDTVWRMRPDPETGRLIPAGVAATLPPGSGPRHAVFTDDGAALVIAGELDGRLHVARWDAATATAVPVGSFPACDCATPALAHVTCHGDSILVGCRGCSRIREHLMVGLTLTPGHTFDLPGGCPRHHALVDGWLVVALQEGHAVVALAPTGEVVGRAAVPSPSSVLASTQESA